jgi:prolyl-tRNA synthetase
MVDKQSIKLKDAVKTIVNLLDDIQENILSKATVFRDKNTTSVQSYKEFKSIISNNGGFVRCGWNGAEETEAAIKNETKATIRCIPFNSDPKGLKCIYSGEKAMHEAIFAKAY